MVGFWPKSPVKGFSRSQDFKHSGKGVVNMGKVTFINAIIQGKLEGVVYSRNKAGFYIKGFTKPLDPATVAQIANRANFGSAASAWHSLGDSAKAQWNTYGAGLFKPKRGSDPSPISGFGAYVALRCQVNFAINKARSNDVTTPAVSAQTFDNFEITQAAPTQPFSAAILDSNDVPVTVSLNSVEFDLYENKVTLDLGFDHSLTSAPKFEDAVGNVPVGYQVCISNPLSQEQQYVQNPLLHTVNVIKPPASFTGWTASDKIVFETDADDLDISGFKLFPSVDSILQATVYAIGQNGQNQRIGACKLTVVDTTP